jgi:uncharacterized surface protein with fasciclin (FAS1) repeats
MKTFKVSILTLVSVLMLVASTTASAVKPSERFTLVDKAVELEGATGLFTTLIALASADDAVLSTLSGNGQFTVFAPTNDAFSALIGAADANCIPLTPELVRSVLLYHVVRGRRDSGDVVASDQLRTLLGAFFAQDGGVITDNAGQNANIIVVDQFADNGVIHAIDTVLLPFPVVNQCS